MGHLQGVDVKGDRRLEPSESSQLKDNSTVRNIKFRMMTGSVSLILTIASLRALHCDIKEAVSSLSAT